ncbi:hypothetical protein [Heyndrickxia shackletonii]|uniref:hypothetical protein n=1 Tax=Heyndrickxia shackletonii TaxID=157838 RepID=UPI00128F857A|nr:hypothetical protein [Heyndrickxia shackletonii]NEY99281.1 hypothetical protein [Heyndrickxia shackletonii]
MKEIVERTGIRGLLFPDIYKSKHSKHLKIKGVCVMASIERTVYPQLNVTHVKRITSSLFSNNRRTPICSFFYKGIRIFAEGHGAAENISEIRIIPVK